MASRQSNFELLRIVSMVMVVLVHVDGASLGLPQPFGDVGAMSGRDVWRLAVESATIIGVNCFTLISGYFGIRLRLRSIAAYLFQCVFYAVGIFSLVWLAFPARFTLGEWLESWLVLSHTDLWYVPAYFGLMLLSPLLNAGAAALSKSYLKLVVGLFVAFNVWCGWWWGAAFNPTGYTVVQLVMVYLLGRYFGLYGVSLRRPAALFAASVAAIFISSLFLPSAKAFAYNSPLVLCATACCFLWFRNMSFRSRAVNYVAASSFAVYLIHKAPLVWGNVMKPSVIALWDTLPLALFSVAAIGIVVAFFAVAMVADAARRRLWQAIVSLKASLEKKVAG